MSTFRTNVKYGKALLNRAKTINTLNERYLVNDLNAYLYSDLSTMGRCVRYMDYVEQGRQQ